MISEEMKTTIRTLYEKGYNKSQISRMLQIDRKTVRAKLKEFDEGLPKKKIRPTILDPYKEYIKIEKNCMRVVDQIHWMNIPELQKSL